MSFFKTLFYFALVTIGLFSCQGPPKTRNELLAIDSLLDAQIKMLTIQKTQLTKEAIINGQTEKSVEVFNDSTKWAYELDVFRQLNLVNRPIYLSKYEVTEEIKDTNSNLSIRSIDTKETLPIRWLKVFYQDIPSKIKKIEGYYTESNSVFSGSRKLSLEFQDIQGRLSLVKYQIDGGQEMMLGDSVAYVIKGEINYSN